MILSADIRWQTATSEGGMRPHCVIQHLLASLSQLKIPAGSGPPSDTILAVSTRMLLPHKKTNTRHPHHSRNLTQRRRNVSVISKTTEQLYQQGERTSEWPLDQEDAAWNSAAVTVLFVVKDHVGPSSAGPVRSDATMLQGATVGQQQDTFSDTRALKKQQKHCPHAPVAFSTDLCQSAFQRHTMSQGQQPSVSKSTATPCCINKTTILRLVCRDVGKCAFLLQAAREAQHWHYSGVCSQRRCGNTGGLDFQLITAPFSSCCTLQTQDSRTQSSAVCALKRSHVCISLIASAEDSMQEPVQKFAPLKLCWIKRIEDELAWEVWGCRGCSPPCWPE